MFGYAASTWCAISKSGKEDEGQGALHMSQYNIIMFEIPIRRHLANTSSPSVPISATITWHHTEHTARLENLSSGTFSSRSKSRNDTDYTGNLTQDRNECSGIGQSHERKYSSDYLKSHALDSSPTGAELQGSVLAIFLRDPSVITKLEEQGRDETGVQIHWQIDRVLSWLQRSHPSRTGYSSIAGYSGTQEMVRGGERAYEPEHDSLLIFSPICS